MAVVVVMGLHAVAVLSLGVAQQRLLC